MAPCVRVLLAVCLWPWGGCQGDVSTQNIPARPTRTSAPITHGWRAGFHSAKPALSSVRPGQAGLAPPCPSLSPRENKSLRRLVFIPPVALSPSSALSFLSRLCPPAPALCPASFCPLHSRSRLQGCGGHSQAALLTPSRLESPSETQLCPHTQTTGRMEDSSFRGAPTSARQPHVAALSLLVLATGLPHIMSTVQVRKSRLRKAC